MKVFAAQYHGKTPARSYADVLEGLAPDAVCDICQPADAGANLPDGAGLEGYDGIALTGSSLHIYRGGQEVERQITLARAAFASRTPMFGSCWGLQVAHRGQRRGCARQSARTRGGHCPKRRANARRGGPSAACWQASRI